MVRSRVVRAPLIFGAIAAFSMSAGAQAAGPERPRFERGIGLRDSFPPSVFPPAWNFTFAFHGTAYTETFIGADPRGDATTTIPVYLIPVELTVQGFGYSPLATLPNGKTIVQNTLDSPIFNGVTDFTQSGVDLGTTQYIDAWWRGSFWSEVQHHPNWHTLLATPVVEPLVTLAVPLKFGAIATAFGINVVEADINWFDRKARSLIRTLGLPANALVLFETAQTYLTENRGCCVGGYHNYAGGHTYGHFTYIPYSGVFAQDVSALSHEVGEWVADPFVNNPTYCGLLEVGDPLETEREYGDYRYTVNGFTYHLQDLVDLPYFGANRNLSVNQDATFQGTHLTACANGS